MTVTFSILCATHNQVDYLADMLDSVSRQTRRDFEVVVVDDGSDDGTSDLLAAWQHQHEHEFEGRMIVLRTEQTGQSAALEHAFRHSSGAWICLLDSDDMFMPHKLEVVAQSVAGMAEVGLIQHPLVVVDQHGNPTGDLRPRSAALTTGDARDQMRRNARHVSPGASGLVVSRATFEALTPFPTKQFRFAADAYISFGATALAPVVAIDQPLALYRMQPGGQYLKRMLDADGLKQQVLFQDTVASHFGLSDAAERNSFFCRNVYAAARFNRSGGSWSALRQLVRATAQDPQFATRRKAVLLVAWIASAVLPRPAFVRFWRAFQMHQTGWQAIRRQPRATDRTVQRRTTE